jgi:hypothetical protein
VRTIVCFAVLILIAPRLAMAQGLGPQPEAVPVDVTLDDLYAAYAQPTAEEMTVRVRGPQGPERNDTLVVRVDPGDDAGRPRRLLLELGQLRVFAEGGKLRAINSNVPSKYFEAPFDGPLTPAAIAGLLPPLPLPQLELATTPRASGFHAPTPYTTGITWSEALAQATVRPHTMTLTGSGPTSTVTVAAHLASARLIRISATIRGRDGETAMELACRPLEPGDPATWALPIDGREPVRSLTELRPTAAKAQGQIAPGEVVPEMSFSRPDLSAWTLSSALGGAPGTEESAKPLALILFRHTAGESRLKDAIAGSSALRSIRSGAGHTQPDPETPAFGTAAAIIIELGEFSREKWDGAGQEWAVAAPGDAPPPTGELLWAPSAAQTIDRFLPEAGAVIVVIGPDRVLRGTVRLDGRASDATAIAAELRALLRPAP